MPHITVRIDGNLADRLDHAIEEGDYQNRSEAIRDCLRHGLPEQQSDRYGSYDDY